MTGFDPCQALLGWLQDAARDPLFPARTRDWHRTVDWCVDEVTCRFALGAEGIVPRPLTSHPADLRLYLDRPTLEELVQGRLPFFLALWGLGRVKYEGPFGDAYRLGYLLGRDRRSHRVAFVAHCWLNLNTRFPGGGSHPGAVPSVVEVLRESGVGIVQMPCPEFKCFGLEKYRYGAPDPASIRRCFRKVASAVVEDLVAYRELEFEVAGLIGMDPSPSCGVSSTKGKGTMLGLDRDVSEQPGPGLFIEVLQEVAEEQGVALPPLLSLRRVLGPAEGEPVGLEEVRTALAGTKRNPGRPGSWTPIPAEELPFGQRNEQGHKH